MLFRSHGDSFPARGTAGLSFRLPPKRPSSNRAPLPEQVEGRTARCPEAQDAYDILISGPPACGGVAEWIMATDCKSVTLTRYTGSNPVPSTIPVLASACAPRWAVAAPAQAPFAGGPDLYPWGPPCAFLGHPSPPTGHDPGGSPSGSAARSTPLTGSTRRGRVRIVIALPPRLERRLYSADGAGSDAG